MLTYEIMYESTTVRMGATESHIETGLSVTKNLLTHHVARAWLNIMHVHTSLLKE